MQFLELLEKRRSVRKYLDRSIPIEVLKKIIDDCTLAPSAGNEQPWKFIVVQNTDLLRQISDDCKESLLSRIKDNPNDYAKKYERMLQNPSFNIFYNAPCLVLIFGESGVKNLQYDCTLAASYFMLSAADRGLGTCWINFAKEIKNPDILEKIGITDKHIIVAPIIIGYPEFQPKPPARKNACILNYAY